MQTLDGQVALVTGAARRIGAAVAKRLHAAGARVAIHYRGSSDEALALAETLNETREDSAAVFQADLLETGRLPALIQEVVDWGGRLDVLVNNASTFYPTPIGEISEDDWHDLMGSNLKAPLFLAQAAMTELRKTRGRIVNIVDIHAQRPLARHTVYGPAKAGLAMLTRSLAKDLAPEIRVNGVSPGAILWPEDGMSDEVKQTILDQVPLARPGDRPFTTPSARRRRARDGHDAFDAPLGFRLRSPRNVTSQRPQMTHPMDIARIECLHAHAGFRSFDSANHRLNRRKLELRRIVRSHIAELFDLVDLRKRPHGLELHMPKRAFGLFPQSRPVDDEQRPPNHLRFDPPVQKPNRRPSLTRPSRHR